MIADFERTMTELDFKKPLLEPAEDRLARELQGDSNFKIDSLDGSLLGRLLKLFSGNR